VEVRFRVGGEAKLAAIAGFGGGEMSRLPQGQAAEVSTLIRPGSEC
jgi:hypothetical protein